jgi:cytochrome P450
MEKEFTWESSLSFQNAFALVNFTRIHMDPKIWGDPEAFRPTRFLDENNNVVKDSKLLAFGSGMN